MTQRKIRPVEDERGLRILGLLGEAHQGEVPAGDARAELTRALGEAVDTADVAAPSNAEAAGMALQLLADDPRFAGSIEAMKGGPQTKAMGPGVVEGAYLIAGLLVALQTRFEVERDKDGRWSIKIKKKATSNALLKPLIKKLTVLLGM